MIYVMNHHSRSADPVRNLLLQQGVDPIVVTDPTDHCEGRETRWLGVASNCCRIMAARDPDKHKIIMHDDVSVAPGLIDKIRTVLWFAPSNAIVSFYNPTNKSYKAASDSGHHVLQTYSNWWTQCHAMPTALGDLFLAWVNERVHTFGAYAEDGMLWRFCSRTGAKVYAVIPSFVQHVGYARSTFGIGSTIGKNKRNSATFDPDFAVTMVDWEHEFADPYPDDKRTMDGEYLRD